MTNKFLFGVSTSSHQIEGNNKNNNWYHWEIERKLERSGIACNSWEQYEEDIERLKFLGCNSYRFSIEWSRVVPSLNKIDIKALNRYQDIINKLKENNIEPVVTLHHFTRPLWVDSLYSGLHNRAIIPHFTFYVETVMQILKGNIKYLITFNEPILELLNGYIVGNRPPGYKGDFEKFIEAIENICDMHSLAYNIIKKIDPNIQVSIAKNLIHFEKQYHYYPIKSYIENNTIKNYNEEIFKALTSGKINIEILPFGLKESLKKEKSLWKNKLDFLGVNHYNICYLDISYFSTENIKISTKNDERGYYQNALGWDICPDTMYNVLKSVKEYNLPIIVTENGSCDSTISSFLQKYAIENHFNGLKKAKKEFNLNIIGYFVWTLMDNFEWDDGYSPQFGLYKRIIEVKKDSVAVKGKLKKSGEYYKKLIQDNLTAI